MDSKARILELIRARQVADAELPRLDHAWLRFDDPAAPFQAQVEGVGGRVLRAENAADIERQLRVDQRFAKAALVYSGIDGIGGNLDLSQIDDPHALEAVDWAILPGEFGVAENGAIWVTDQGLPHRAIYFIVQHLALVLPESQLVHNMHEAYARVSLGESSFGAFISGPSKTADIEQSLVIGAHGPRSLTVFLVPG